MEMIIKSINFEMNDTIHAYITNKFSHLAVPDDMSKFHLILEKHHNGTNKGQYEIKFHAHYFKKEHHLENSSNDLYQGIDSLFKKVQRQMSDEKEKTHSHLHRQRMPSFG